MTSMKGLALVALALACLACANAQRCDMPQEFEARVVRFDPDRRYYHNHTSQYRSYGAYAYDGVELRIWRREDITVGDSATDRVEVLELYKSQKAYVTNLTTGKCTSYNINFPFRHHDINPNARFVGYETLGNSEDSITLSQWVAVNQTYHGEPGAHVYQTFTQECVPVRDDVMVPDSGFHYEEFTDVTLGVQDPNIWIPPADCHSA
ncbi:uncharacterized protein MONBRDRAFT_35848 [Monosiga brevicollis MX1]|uniref:Uncharacterized protein n=1 Tax=Monosiga brevicollis TaxID=81824 RepID=A9US61_MONBE|nr:uncharacterized protein MONBRDRAFT_35848 [Monosiga brevicollis MX1]EDQ91724.1 predicted protein [Monosiga brevicollis MX1]|eukprot:XP_001743010.1 hypothetical protein [Monosiga brevicollis MX1]